MIGSSGDEMKDTCLTFNLVVYDKYKLKYDRICMYRPHIRKNRNMGCHACSHSPNKFIFENINFCIQGVREQFGINEKLSWGCKMGQIRYRGTTPHRIH